MAKQRQRNFWYGVLLLPTIGPALAMAQSEAPSAEMLEFLGGWEAADGDALDPIAWMEFFDDPVFKEQGFTEQGDSEVGEPENEDETNTEDSSAGQTEFRANVVDSSHVESQRHEN